MMSEDIGNGPVLATCCIFSNDQMATGKDSLRKIFVYLVFVVFVIVVLLERRHIC